MKHMLAKMAAIRSGTMACMEKVSNVAAAAIQPMVSLSVIPPPPSEIAVLALKATGRSPHNAMPSVWL
jgi:hypothetical protein